MCFLNFPLLLFSFLPEEILIPIGKKFSLLLFWIENSIYVIGFAAVEFLMIPLVYFKMIIIIPWVTLGLFTSIFYTAFWVIGGVFIVICMTFRDIYNFMLLLSMHEGSRQNDADDDKEDEDKLRQKERVMNEVRTEVIKLYFEIKKQRLGLIASHEEEEEEKKRDYEKINVIEMIENDAYLYESDQEEEEQTV